MHRCGNQRVKEEELRLLSLPVAHLGSRYFLSLPCWIPGLEVWAPSRGVLPPGGRARVSLNLDYTCQCVFQHPHAQRLPGKERSCQPGRRN